LDNVTHTLVGATLGRAVFHRAGRGTTAALVLASNAPDADIVMAAGGTLDYLAWHRGPTHGPLGVVGLATLTAALVWAWQRQFDRQRATEHASFPALLGVALAGLVCHVLMDFPTSYGTRLFSPFNWQWYATDLMPIVDIYLLIVLVGGMALGHARPTVRRQAAAAAIAFTLMNYVARAVAHQWALSRATAVMAPTLFGRCRDGVPPSLISRWPTESATKRRDRGADRCLVEMAAIPTFLSPLRWQIIARNTDFYETLALDLLRDPPRAPDAIDAPWRSASRYPDQWTPAALRAANTELGRVFLGFSRFPATESVLNADESATVRWTDLRFNTPDRPGLRGLFSAVVTVAADGRVLAARLGETEN
jgi:membrane-bound metal-dependent hydrolase YbcI (DUF457 family)